MDLDQHLPGKQEFLVVYNNKTNKVSIGQTQSHLTNRTSINLE